MVDLGTRQHFFHRASISPVNTLGDFIRFTYQCDLYFSPLTRERLWRYFTVMKKAHV